MKDLEKTFGYKQDEEDPKILHKDEKQQDKEIIKRGEDSLMVSLSLQYKKALEK